MPKNTLAPLKMVRGPFGTTFVKIYSEIGSKGSPGGQSSRVATLEKIAKDVATLSGHPQQVTGPGMVQGGHGNIWRRRFSEMSDLPT